MPHVDDAIALVRSAAEDVGRTELARRSGVHADTVKNLLRDGTGSVKTLRALEAESAKHASAQRKKYSGKD